MFFVFSLMHFLFSVSTFSHQTETKNNSKAKYVLNKTHKNLFLPFFCLFFFSFLSSENKGDRRQRGEEKKKSKKEKKEEKKKTKSEKKKKNRKQKM